MTERLLTANPIRADDLPMTTTEQQLQPEGSDTMNDDLDTITTTDLAALVGAILAEGSDTAIESIDVEGRTITVELLNGQTFTLTAQTALDYEDDDDEQDNHDAIAHYDSSERCAHGHIVGSCLADCDDDLALDGFDAFAHIPDRTFVDTDAGTWS